MLTNNDIELINEWRDEMLSNRQRYIDVTYTGNQYDPITGVLIGEGPESRTVDAVITEHSGASIELQGGVVYENIDIKADISIELIDDIFEDISRISLDEKEYRIVAWPKKGIGRRNRYELLGRSIT